MAQHARIQGTRQFKGTLPDRADRERGEKRTAAREFIGRGEVFGSARRFGSRRPDRKKHAPTIGRKNRLAGYEGRFIMCLLSYFK